jgi:CAAX prenyl protease-like protein
MSLEQTSLMAKGTGTEPAAGKTATLAYIAPFVVFVALLVLRRWVPLEPEFQAPARFVLVAATLAVFSRRVIPWRPAFLAGSIVLGLAVFAVWIGPDRLWGTAYRDSLFFRNSVLGAAVSSLPERLKADAFFIVIRVLESAILIPILEELFWRAWLMRWLIRPHFQSVPLGQYSPLSFWAVAVFFASEHGAYWEVGLIAGIAYNWWMVRTRSLADCILAHAVTNAVLAGYVLWFNQWQYWL